MTHPIPGAVARPSTPHRWQWPTAAAWLLVAALQISGITLFLLSPHVRGPILWCLGGAIVLAAVSTVTMTARLRQANDLAAHQQDAGESLVRQLPEAVHQIRQGAAVKEVLDALRSRCGPAISEAPLKVAESLLGMVRAHAREVEGRRGERESARRVLIRLAQRMQSAANQQLEELRQAEKQHHGNPVILKILFELDHATMITARLADNIAVLGGGQPHRQWRNPVTLEEVVGGAKSRIADYSRVHLTGGADQAVDRGVVETVTHALAELLDNAARSSPPHTRVEVNVRRVHRGVAIEIEDGGVGMSEENLERGRTLLAGERHLDLALLGEDPRFGLAVVGLLVRPYGIKVDLKTSAYGGVRAVVFLPKQLLQAPPEDLPLTTAPPVQASPPSVSPAAPAAAAAEPERSRGTTANGLPRRIRTAPVAAGPPPAADPPVAPATDSDRPQRNAFMAAVVRSRERTAEPDLPTGPLPSEDT